MSIERRLRVPTGDILIVTGRHGKLECLSLGDYGKANNIKADFLGFTEEINGVEHGPLMPLSEKWVVTISTQYGCSMGCRFCDVPKVGLGRNASAADMRDQVLAAMSIHPEITTTKRLNVHFARMGEPTWNPTVMYFARWLLNLQPDFMVHPVVSTMAPRKNRHFAKFVRDWMGLKNDLYGGNAGLQLSINSTDNDERDEMFNGNAMTLVRLSRIMSNMPEPKGRKIALNFALAGYTIDAEWLAALFPPDRFMCKLTPMHVTRACGDNGIRTDGGYEFFHPYQKDEEALKAAGFDVIVFVPSLEEDRGRITCGNAILAGTLPECAFEEDKRP